MNTRYTTIKKSGANIDDIRNRCYTFTAYLQPFPTIDWSKVPNMDAHTINDEDRAIRIKFCRRNKRSFNYTQKLDADMILFNKTHDLNSTDEEIDTLINAEQRIKELASIAIAKTGYGFIDRNSICVRKMDVPTIKKLIYESFNMNGYNPLSSTKSE